jgi:hypothetical protein
MANGEYENCPVCKKDRKVTRVNRQFLPHNRWNGTEMVKCLGSGQVMKK